MKIKVSNSEKHVRRRLWIIWMPVTAGLLVWAGFMLDAALTARFGA